MNWKIRKICYTIDVLSLPHISATYGDHLEWGVFRTMYYKKHQNQLTDIKYCIYILCNISFEKQLLNHLYMEHCFDFLCNVPFEKQLLNILYMEIGFDFVFNISFEKHVFRVLSLLLHRESCRFTNYHTTNKCTNCMSFILNHFFKTLSLLLHVSIAYRLSSSRSTYSS